MFKLVSFAPALALLSVFLALPVLAAPDASVVVAAPVVAPPAATAPAPAVPSTTTTTTVKTVTPAVEPPMLADYTPLIGGAFLVVAFFLRRMTSGAGWFHTPNGGYVIVFLSTIAASCAEAVQRHGFSKSVLIVAAGQAMLTFVAMSDPKPKTDTSNPNAVLPPDPPAKS